LLLFASLARRGHEEAGDAAQATVTLLDAIARSDGTLTEIVRGDLSTGEFAGATGTLSGHVHVSGGAAIVTLSGSISLRDP
jgi:hypothetical protein